MRNSCSLNSLFPCQLALAVNIEMAGRIVFGVWSCFAAVKNVIGGIVDESCANFVCLLRQDSRALSVDGISELRLFFRLIHGSVSRGVHDQIWPNLRYRTMNGKWIGHIQPPTIQSHNFSDCRQDTLEFPP